MIDIPGNPGADAGIRLEAAACRESEEVRQARRLRYRVRGAEMQRRAPSRAMSGEDRFDRCCEHLIVRDVDADRIVGTCRVLAPEGARRAGAYRAERAFDLEMLEVLRDRMVEVDGPCMDPEYDPEAVMALLWTGLARYLVENRHDYVMAAACVSLADGGHAAASIYRAASEAHMSPVDLRAIPRCRLPLEALCEVLEPDPPPVLRGYLELGAWICGEPALQPDFGCASFPLLLPLARMRGRFARHFLARAA